MALGVGVALLSSALVASGSLVVRNRHGWSHFIRPLSCGTWRLAHTPASASAGPLTRSAWKLHEARATEVQQDEAVEASREYLTALLVFGRLADHLGITNTKYRPDLDLPFSLWVSLPLSRRLKNDYPQWKPLFEPDGIISRTEFRSRVRASPFKYPRGNETHPAPLPLMVRDRFPMATLQGLRADEETRKDMNRMLEKVELLDVEIDAVFDTLRAGHPMPVGEDELRRESFEMTMLRWASEDPETEGDPVVEWEVFWSHVRDPLARAAAATQ